jgi:hypothetical protein
VTGIFHFLTPLQEIYILSSEWTRAAALKKIWFSRIWIVNGVAQSLIKKPGTPKTLYQRKKKKDRPGRKECFGEPSVKVPGILFVIA